ncbi:GNAT family N-acetyltransferase [Streptomyces sp. SID8111]|uniref:GNAT family N-acetyltransferase n=1 Tax=Streptomyces sp. SID8111 TaxID=2706100 RepID=UPI0013BFEB43|nr:GNAT family N-acetyltransferase [Streptomyces sp. SID8111]NEC26794.1 GNAT family N-acetyltransferase [Streptomyces sp. SID8111]
MTTPAPGPPPGPLATPPAPLRTARLVLRQAEPRDRARFIALLSSPEVYAHLGGARPREELEQVVPRVPGRRPGVFVIDRDGEMIGTVELKRRGPQRPGHVRPQGGEVELGYLLLPEAWGHGYAAEACAAVLGLVAATLPGEPVVLCTHVANVRSLRLAARLGFTEVDRFEEWGAEQWFGVWRPGPPLAGGQRVLPVGTD